MKTSPKMVDVENKGWTSEKLAAVGSTSKGNIYSPWRVRVNAGKKTMETT